MLLEDSSGINMEKFRMSFSRDGAEFQPVKNLEIPKTDTFRTVPIRYKPVLFPGYYIFRITAEDYNGYRLGDGPFYEFVYQVEKNPDLQAPEIVVLINKEPLVDQVELNIQPKFEIHIKDDYQVADETIELFLGRSHKPLESISSDNYQIYPVEKTRTILRFAPDLSNGIYHIRVQANDTSENISDMKALSFELNEMIKITDYVNVPNPILDNTVFTYNLAQAADQVTIKIYTISGRLIQTLENVSSQRGYNEAFWDVRDILGHPLANGTYFYKITAHSATKASANSHVSQIGKLAILR